MNLPKEITSISKILNQAGFKAYLVGGCLRDMILGREPQDWDIGTDATPTEIEKLFIHFAEWAADKPATVYENQFGTVGIKTGSADPALKIVEVTTFRLEGKYTDKRHPDEVKFAGAIEEDLSRRDFTVNAMAMDLAEGKTNRALVDPFGGQSDLKKKLMRAVGDPGERFSEDALRLMRAVRLSAELGFKIEPKTESAIKKHCGLLEAIAKERIRDEFTKLIMSPNAEDGIKAMEKLGLLKFVVPELCEGVGVSQNKHHIYTVFEHNTRALGYAVSKNYSLEVRMASLLHDVGKPKTKRGEGPDSTFYGHEVVGGKMTARILDRLRFSREFVERVAHLVRCHLFYYNVDEVTAAGVRRFLNRVGPENVDDLIKVREADRIGSGVPKAVPYKIRHLLFMIEKVKRDPVSPRMLSLDGNDVMKIARIAPGPKIGYILSILLEGVLDDPALNEKEILEKKIAELAKLSDKELENLSRKARERKDEFEGGVEEKMKEKFWVK